MGEEICVGAEARCAQRAVFLVAAHGTGKATHDPARREAQRRRPSRTREAYPSDWPKLKTEGAGSLWADGRERARLRHRRKADATPRPLPYAPIT